jgi:HSP20 family protein
MKNTIPYQAACSIYPGQYMPLLNEKTRAGLKHMHECDNVFLYISLTELPGSFKVEVAIPGVERDEFLVTTDDNILSVCVIHKKIIEGGSRKAPSQGFNYECFDRTIILPENVDVDFISAEYKAGILCIHVPKTRQPVKNLHSEIIVY